jgi:hypothetical protein
MFTFWVKETSNKTEVLDIYLSLEQKSLRARVILTNVIALIKLNRWCNVYFLGERNIEQN